MILIFLLHGATNTEIYTYAHTLSLHDALPIDNGRQRTSTRPADSSMQCDTWPWPSGMVAGMPSLYRRTPRMPKLARAPKPRIDTCRPYAWLLRSPATTPGPRCSDSDRLRCGRGRRRSRKRSVSGNDGSVRVDLGGWRRLTNKK